MKSILYILLLSFLFIGCTENKKPADLIPEVKMKAMLIDMHLTEASRIGGNDSVDRLMKASYEFIFKKYDVDTAVFRRSMNYYISRPEELDKMYETMIDSLAKRETRLTELAYPSTKETSDPLRRLVRFEDRINDRDSIANRFSLIRSLRTRNLQEKIKPKKDSLKKIAVKDSLKVKSLKRDSLRKARIGRRGLLK